MEILVLSSSCGQMKECMHTKRSTIVVVVVVIEAGYQSSHWGKVFTAQGEMCSNVREEIGSFLILWEAEANMGLDEQEFY